MLTSMLWLFVLTALGWSFFMFFLKPVWHFSFVRTPIRSFIYFACITVGIGYLFLPLTYELFTNVSSLATWVLGVAMVLVFPVLYANARKVSGTYIPVVEQQHLELVRLEYAFLFSKFADVVFQQTTTGILLLLLAPHVPFVLLIPIFAVIFVCGHIGLLFRIPHDWFLFFGASAFVGGAIIPVLILSVSGGIYYAITLHMLWYVGTGIAYRRLGTTTAPR